MSVRALEPLIATPLMALVSSEVTGHFAYYTVRLFLEQFAYWISHSFCTYTVIHAHQELRDHYRYGNSKND